MFLDAHKINHPMINGCGRALTAGHSCKQDGWRRKGLEGKNEGREREKEEGRGDGLAGERRWRLLSRSLLEGVRHRRSIPVMGVLNHLHGPSATLATQRALSSFVIHTVEGACLFIMREQGLRSCISSSLHNWNWEKVHSPDALLRTSTPFP